MRLIESRIKLENMFGTTILFDVLFPSCIRLSPYQVIDEGTGGLVVHYSKRNLVFERTQYRFQIERPITLQSQTKHVHRICKKTRT